MKLNWKTCFRIGLTVFLLYLAIYYWEAISGGVSLFFSAAAPLLLGCAVAYVVNILMACYERHCFPKRTGPQAHRIRRITCMLVAFVTLLGVAALVIWLVIPELISCVQLLIAEIPPALNRLVELIQNSGLLSSEVMSELERLTTGLDWQSLITRLLRAVSTGLTGMMGSVVSTVSTVVSSVITAAIGLIVAIYLLLGKERLARQCNRLLDAYLKPAFTQRLRLILDTLNDCFHRFIVGQCIEAIILGVLCTLGMLLLQFPYAVMIGTLIGFTALIPIAGAYIGAFVGALMILTQSPLQALGFLVFIVVLQQLEGNLIYPRVVGTSIGLPGLWVLSAVTIGGSLAGIPGMLIGVPLTASIYQLLRMDVRRREGTTPAPTDAAAAPPPPPSSPQDSSQQEFPADAPAASPESNIQEFSQKEQDP